MTRILTVSTLFPNPAQPNLGLFVAERLRLLMQSGQIDARVVAPVPWFPSDHPYFGKYAVFARVPERSRWNGIEVLHPRYPVVPGPGWYLTPLGMKFAIQRAARQVRSSGFDFDLVDAHYYFPDGVGAALAIPALGKPLVITARGTDINLIPRFRLARALVRWAGRQAAASICVAQALKDEMLRLGFDAAAVHVMRNGVDLDKFRPIDRAHARRSLGLAQQKILLSVGYLIERKGHHVIIEAMRQLPDWHLMIVGDGELRQSLRQQAVDAGVAARVQFIGAVPQHELPSHYCAADIVVLASSREGMPNVVLEALACGTPVLATRAWGTPEILADPRSGSLLESRTPEAVVAGVRRMESEGRNADTVRAYSESLGWDATVRGQVELFDKIARGVSA
jgi:teichuronic acid biosynthesis glycosyltransferase TuaC